MAEQHLFTCISCAIAFTAANEQRIHYRSDHHRYNMKRRVASLPPISATVFNEKVLERRAQNALQLPQKASICNICNKTYTTENAYRSHVISKKHKDAELKAFTQAQSSQGLKSAAIVLPNSPMSVTESSSIQAKSKSENGSPQTNVATQSSVDEIEQSIDQKITSARTHLTVTHCLFCSEIFENLDVNLQHMSQAHSFFIPETEYLIDKEGLITYLGEKMAVGNVCIYCNGKGREFRSLDAVRKHMLDKSHCKIAYDKESDRLELSDYYDFRSSYPDFGTRRITTQSPSALLNADSAEDEEWEDTDDDDVDKIIDKDGPSALPSDTEENDDPPNNELTYGDSLYELVLPSGARIGHRSLRRYYTQSLSRSYGNTEGSNSGAAIVRQLLADKKLAVVPSKGGFGAFGAGTKVVKARNIGEAHEAGRHIREFRDQRRREDFKTKVGFRHNHQKHYRDALLQ